MLMPEESQEAFVSNERLKYVDQWELCAVECLDTPLALAAGVSIST